MTVYAVIGASRGIGAAATKQLVAQGNKVIAVSRTPAAAGTWVQADIGTDAGIARVVDAVQRTLKALGEKVGLDALLFLGGVWEQGAFTKVYDFSSSPIEETRFLMSVNLTAPILLAQALAVDLSRSANPKIILNGSTSGLQNAATPEVANTATKFGLQGAAEALNISLRGHGISATVVNFDNVATPEVIDDIATGLFGPQTPIPMSDLLTTYDYLLKLSADTVPQTINLMQKYPEA
ncbi:MAG: SDR family oxidoreductase [Pseudomonadota bacterium]